MNCPEFVTDETRYHALRAECDGVVDTSKRLPKMIFRRPCDQYFAFEHAQIATKDFGTFLRSVATVFGDTSVNYMTIEPHPVDYYHKHYAFFGLAVFDPTTIEQRYLPVMNREGSVDSFLYRGGDVGLFWGSSLRWAIGCDRISWEIAVMGVIGQGEIKPIGSLRFMDGALLTQYVEAQYRARPDAVRGFAEEYLSNYGRGQAKGSGLNNCD